MARATLDAGQIAGLEAAAFATAIEADGVVAVDRTMTWDGSGYGSHSEHGVPAPSNTWYLAEGATHSGFQLFYLLQNPNPTPVTVTVQYLLPAPKAPVIRSYRVLANSRANVWVNTEPALANTDVSAVLTSDSPIIVERAMYLDRPGQPLAAGHESAGVTEPALTWFLAEGATGTFFDLFILVANPGLSAAACDIRFLLPDGTAIQRTATVAPRSRFNVWVDAEGGRLASTAVSTTVSCNNPVVVERAMWWPGPTAATWAEAHNSAGNTATGTRWALADGEQGGPASTETYVLIANTSPFDGSVKVTLCLEDGAPVERVLSIRANSRLNVAVGAPVDAGGFGAASRNTRFGIIVESLAAETAAVPAQLVVERATYSNAGGVVWAAGTNAIGTRLP
jgi:hypothetical protein